MKRLEKHGLPSKRRKVVKSDKFYCNLMKETNIYIYVILLQIFHNRIHLFIDKYCVEFVTHCQKILPNSTRSVQVAILTALNLFVDRLILLKMSKAETSPKDKKLLSDICDSLNKILSYCISKYDMNYLCEHD